MRRMEVYLDEGLWSTLRERAQREETSVSQLLRRAVRERYASGFEERRVAMQALVGLWSDREDIPDAETYLSDLRKSDRIKRLHKRRS